MRRIAPLAIALISLVLLTAGCGGSSGDSGDDDELDRRRLAGSEGVRRRGLRQLPHDEGGERDRHGRPEPRRAEAERGDRRPAGDERRERHALVQGRADDGGDPAGRRLRRDRRRSRLRREDLVRAGRQEGRGLPGRERASSRRSGTSPTRRARRAALEKLAELSSSNPVVAGGCHPIAHKIGAGGLLHFEGDVGKAFADGDGTCGSGFYHGLLQWKLAGARADQVAGVAASVCNDPEIKANAFIYYQCDHGLGHGLMLYTAYDLPKALDYCHKLNTEFDRVSCSGGVFMENQSSSFGLRTKWLKQEQPALPLQQQARPARRQALLLPPRHLAHPPQRQRRLEEDGRLVQTRRARLDSVLLPVLRP